jgi:multiple sugar transport system substrate-binding protein
LAVNIKVAESPPTVEVRRAFLFAALDVPVGKQNEEGLDMESKISRLAAAAAVALLVTVTLVTLLSGIDDTASANDQVTLVWYVRPETLENQWEEELVQAFQSAHPAITIELMPISWDEFAPRLNGMWLQGNPPDVWSHHGSNGFVDFYQKGWLADLSPFINGPNPLDLDDFFTEIIDMYTMDGKVYGLPMLSGGSFVFYNRDIFDAAGVAYPPTDWNDPTWTWDAMVSKAISLTKNYGDPDNVQYGMTMGLWPWDAYAWLWGQDLFPSLAYQTGFASEAYLDTPAATLAYQARQDLICKHHVSPSPDEEAAIGEGYSGVFSNQRTAMVTTGAWGLWAFKDAGFPWGFAALPKGTPAAKDVVFTDPWVMSSATGHPDEAWEFLKFLVSRDAQRAYMQILNAPPARQSLMPEWSQLFSATMTITQVQQVHAGAFAHGAESPNHLLVGYDEINDVLGGELSPLWENCEASVTDTLISADLQLEETLAGIIEMSTVPTVTLDGGTGGVLTSNDGIATLNFGAGTVSETTVVSLTSEYAILEAPGLVNSGSVVHVVATVRGTGETVTQTNIPYTMTVGYDEGALGTTAARNLNQVQENSLDIYWWNPVLRVWEREIGSQVNTEANIVRATPSRFGLFAVLGKHQIYLPFVVKSYR